MRVTPAEDAEDAELISIAATEIDGDSTTEPSYEEIASEAYARFLSRGGADGGDVTDWLEAEQALRDRRRARGE
jgi:Protein of unknown function (DUF2934)